MTKFDVEQAILAVVRESGPIGWYGIEMRLRVPRSEFKDGYATPPKDERASPPASTRREGRNEARSAVDSPMKRVSDVPWFVRGCRTTAQTARLTSFRHQPLAGDPGLDASATSVPLFSKFG